MKHPLIGKEVKVPFRDDRKVLVKEGVLVEANSEYVTLKINGKNQSLPIGRVIRIEEK